MTRFCGNKNENARGWPVGPTWAGYEILASGRRAEGSGAFGARADVAKMVVAIDAGGMPVGEAKLNRVVAHLCGGFGPGLRLEHG